MRERDRERERERGEEKLTRNDEGSENRKSGGREIEREEDS